ncbi:tyrosine-protein phosphatase [Lacticaseibacillus zhaodongensis]|uniref:tyrosine-protein phosphatase n=1 Tax=Lacticaseibacillus zhaodongensis TaxID=2668065 RepID=UPI0012D2ADDE|nr:tyrosine-protein phosphatase [Lacticaseibacillus zhaodongensis]
MEPMLLNIHHGFNFRDMGGYPGAGMHTIKKHKLIRSGKLDELSDRDVHFLSDYGVRFDVDFRSADEKKAAPDRVPHGASYYSFPVFPTDETQVSKTREEEFKQFAADPRGGYKNMLQTYADMVLQDDAQKAYRQFFDLLLSNPDDGQALLFHCSAGKDRTGMGAVYLMSALGVNMATIKQDYIAANDYIQEPLRQILSSVQKQGANANLEQSITDLWTVKEDYLDSALTTIDHNYGSMRNYLHEALNLSDEQVTDLQRIYLV